MFAFLGAGNAGRAIVADSTPDRLVLLAIAGSSLFIALVFSRSSRANHRARTARSET